MLSVIVIAPDGSRRQETFDKASIAVGRVAEGNDVVLPGNAVSACHAVIASRDGGWVIADVGSTNGTWVNGQRIDGPVRVGADDVVQVGEYTLQVQGQAADQAVAPTAGGATVAIDMPPPASRSASGISWATMRQDGSEAPHDGDPATWSTLQAAAVNEESHGAASVRIVPASTPSKRFAAVCMSCGVQFSAQATFCQACGARRVPEDDHGGAPAQPQAPTGYEATGAIPVVQASTTGYEATGAIPVVQGSMTGYEPTGVIPVVQAPIGYEATGVVSIVQPPTAYDVTGAMSSVHAEPAPPLAPADAHPGGHATRVIHTADVVPSLGPQSAPAFGATGPSVVVDPNGTVGFQSIQDALRMAPAGAVIRVRAGVYPGSVVLDRPLSLIAEGGPVVVESAQGPCLVSFAAAGLIHGFVFRMLPGAQPDAGVVVSRGSLRLERCELSGARGPGMIVEGPESEPVVVECVIRGAAAEGVIIRTGARPRIDRCEIALTGRAGICVQEGGVPMVTRCSVHDTQAQGLLVHGESAGVFDECDIATCRLAGIDVLNGGRPTVRRCRVRDSREGCGVIVQYGGAGVFEDCVVSGHRLSAVEVREGGQPWFRRCSLIESQLERGVYAYDQGGGVFEDCEIGRSRRHGVGVRSGAQPTLRRCRIHGSLEAGGVYVYRQGKGVFEDCEIAANRDAGVEVVEGSEAVLARCRVHDNGGGALRLVGNHAVYATECEFAGTTSRALLMEQRAQAKLERCAFVGECVCGVDCTCDTTGSTFRPA